MKNVVLLFFILILLSSCIKDKRTDYLQYSLENAGENRIELEKVLEHYNQSPGDSLKLMAAEFLIENMGIYSTVKSKSLDKHYAHFDSVFADGRPYEDINWFTILWHIDNYTPPVINDFTYTPDIKYVSADLLIDNIDKAFDAWKNPWAKHLTFEEFCEYLLPYKVKDEVPDFWRTEFKEYYYDDVKDFINEPYSKELLIKAIDSLRIKISAFNIGKLVMLGGYKPSYLRNLKFGGCDDLCALNLYVSRSLGIPICVDFTPHWANRSIGHSWTVYQTGNTAITDRDSIIDYNMSDSMNTMGTHTEDKGLIPVKTAKYYRKTYAMQPNSLLFKKGNESIPPFFLNPCFKDITELYRKDCVDVEISLKYKIKNNRKFVYICNFDNQTWVPVHWSEIKRGKAVFTKMNKGIMYICMFYDEDKILKPATDPFILTEDGDIVYICPDTEKIREAVIERKFPNRHYDEHIEKLIDARFQLSDRVDFKDCLTVYVVDTLPEAKYNNIHLNLNKPYRYFRYLAPPGSSGGDIAEVKVYSGHPKRELKGEIFGPNDSGTLPNVFDGNHLTYYVSWDHEISCAGLDFREPLEISQISFLPRNDDNFIVDGEDYELYYWNNKWISLGKRKGTDKQYLEFSNVPDNALLLLKNHTKGKEERIFTYENNKQVWW